MLTVRFAEIVLLQIVLLFNAKINSCQFRRVTLPNLRKNNESTCACQTPVSYIFYNACILKAVFIFVFYFVNISLFQV
jgi:hypothetical protein